MTNPPPSYYGVPFTQADRRNVLRLAAMMDGLPSYRTAFDTHGNPLLRLSKGTRHDSQYLPTGYVSMALVEASGRFSRSHTPGVMVGSDVYGNTWEVTEHPNNPSPQFAIRYKSNPYKRSPLISLGVVPYYALFEGYGTLPATFVNSMVQHEFTAST